MHSDKGYEHQSNSITHKVELGFQDSTSVCASRKNLTEIWYEGLDKVWHQSPKSSTASAMTLSPSGANFHKRNQSKNRSQKKLVVKNTFQEQLDEMWRLLPADQYPSRSNSESLTHFKIEEEKDDLELKPLETLNDKVTYDLTNGVKEHKTQNPKEGIVRLVKHFKSAKINPKRPVILERFPDNYFKAPIDWSFEGKPYEAKNAADLRYNHSLLIEGTFKKSK